MDTLYLKSMELYIKGLEVDKAQTENTIKYEQEKLNVINQKIEVAIKSIEEYKTVNA